MNKKFDGIDKKFDGISKKFDGIDKKFDGISKKFDGIDKKFDGIDKKFDGISKKFDGIDKKFDDIKETIRGIEDGIFTVAGFNTIKAIEHNSPMSLTENGKKFVAEADPTTLVGKYYDKVEKLIKEKEPKSSLQAEEEILRTMVLYKEIINEKERTKIENIAFDYGLSSNGLVAALTVLFREKFLEKNPL